MASQSFTITGIPEVLSNISGSRTLGLNFASNNRVNAGLRTQTRTYLTNIFLQAPRPGSQYRLVLYTSGQSVGSGAGDGPDLTVLFEQNWVITIEVGLNSWVFRSSDFSSDTAEAYIWVTTNSGAQADLLAAFNAAVGQSGIVVTLADSPTPVAHTATASPVNWAFELPEAAATRTGVLLTLADALIPDGRQLVGMASLITVPTDGDVYDSDATVLGGADPPNLGASNLTPLRIYVTGRSQLRISNDGLGNIETVFGSGGAQEDYQIHIQTSQDNIVSYDRDDIDGDKSTNGRLLIGPEGDPGGLLDNVEALSSGDRVLFFLTEPEAPTPVAHTATASPVNWAFELPEAAATRTARTPVAHTATASPVNWAFELPEAAAIERPVDRAGRRRVGDGSGRLRLCKEEQYAVTARQRLYIIK